MKPILKIVLWLIIIVLLYFVYDSIASKIKFEKETMHRRDFVIERLKDIRTAQIAFKMVNDFYADNFDSLLYFVKNDSFPLIMAVGTVPDTLSEEEAVQMGIVTRDTSYINVKDSIFSSNYLQDHLASFHIDSLPRIPFGRGEKFRIRAGEVEKGKVRVKVFEVFASYGVIYQGLDMKNEDIDLNDGLKVGSMEEPSTSGNWGE
ncbi:MAG: hypothetical protein ABII90_10765 [Bacteroidota bacterium]